MDRGPRQNADVKSGGPTATTSRVWSHAPRRRGWTWRPLASGERGGGGNGEGTELSCRSVYEIKLHLDKHSEDKC